MKAYIFPGQGSQFSGMAKDLYDNYPLAREMMDAADGILGFRLTDIMFNGSDEQLKSTKVTQPAVFLHSAVAAACLEDFKPDMTAGHSLGEFSALVAAGAMSFEDGLKLVSVRALAMQKCCEMAEGAMAAIIGLPQDKIEEICEETDGIVVPANYNSDVQTVISGERAAIEAACAKASEAGARRALVLAVGGAFHSPLMEPARLELAEAIERTAFRTPVCPVYQNVTAFPETSPEAIKTNLLAQLTSPVRWTQTVRNMRKDGASEFIELGPGNVLAGLIKRISIE